jgi:uncharacterized protein YukE
MRIPYATPDLLLKHPDTCNIQNRQMKHLKHTSETLTKTLQTIAKDTQHPDKTLATYV